MARVRRWPEAAEQERLDAIAFFDDILSIAEKIEKHARTDPQIIEALALRIQRRAIEGKHTLVLAKPTKGGQP